MFEGWDPSVWARPPSKGLTKVRRRVIASINLALGLVMLAEATWQLTSAPHPPIPLAAALQATVGVTFLASAVTIGAGADAPGPGVWRRIRSQPRLAQAAMVLDTACLLVASVLFVILTTQIS